MWGCRGFLRFWTASTVSGFGTYITTLAVQILVVVTLHQQAAGVGLVSAARWLPYTLFGVLVGVLVDRSRRRPILIITDLGRGALLIAIPLLAFSHHLSLVVLIVFMAVFGLMSLFNDAAFQSFLPRLVPPSLLTSANTRLNQSDPVAQTSGPALAGGLVSLLTAPWAVLIDAATYFISGLLLLRSPVIEPPPTAKSTRKIRADAVEGIRWVYTHPMLRPLALSTHGWFLCSAVTSAVLVPFALRTLGLNAFGLGLSLAAGGLGGLVGSLSATRLGTRFAAGRVVIACRALAALSWAVVALSTNDWGGWVLFGFGQFLFGLSMGAENANEMSYWQAVTPDRLQGRMNATRRSINRSMLVIGAPLGGLLADTIGYRPMLWAAAAGFLTAATALGLSRFRNARLDETPTAST